MTATSTNATIKYETCFPESEVSRVSFFLMGNEDHSKASNCDIISKDLFSNDRPLDNGIYSLSMGTTSYSYRCKTCQNPRDKCPGHFGAIQLRYPVSNPLFRGEVLRWLRQVCHFCGCALGKVSDDGSFKASTSNKAIVCANCHGEQPTITRDMKEPLFLNKRVGPMDDVRLFNDEIEAIFARVSKETALMIGSNPEFHPSSLMLRTVPAVPNNARPDVRKLKSSTRSNNNDTTTFIKNVISTNESVPMLLTAEEKDSQEAILNLLEITYSNMVRDPSGTATASRIVGGNGQALTSLGARLRGKEGRIRGNLEGKRFQHGGRSVICGDNSIDIDEVGIPTAIAKVLQMPEVVRPYNIDRLMTFFLNKNTTYPGCTKLVKGDTGATYHIASMKNNIKLEYGDILYRDLVDGDNVAMNRAPSLLYSAISGHRARILGNGDTFRLSVNVADTLYGGDFDGDAMSIYLPHSLIARNECGTLSNLKRWFISFKDRSPAMGVYHDNAIGISEFTQNKTTISRYHAMQLLSQVKYENYLHRFEELDPSKTEYSGREIISLLLPEINFSKKASFFKPEYSGFIDYKKDETHVVIERGVLKSGVLDKKSIGQGVNDSLFHNVYNEYGVDAAMDLLYNMQQVSTQYLMSRGYTINYDDFAIDKKTLKNINDVTASIIHQSNQLTKKYRAGLITPPIGMTVEEFYEQEQMNILSPGDEFTEVVMSSLDHENNNLAKLVSSGTKGKPTNILQISSSIGQMSIKGKRMRKAFDFQRALPYARRFHDEPEAVGFIADSFVTGVSFMSAIAQQQDGRNGITTKALSTGVTGYHNRKANKALEAVIIDNHRRTMKYDFMLQPLYGDDGVDIRKATYVDFGVLLAGNVDFDKLFKLDESVLPANMRNATMTKVLTEMYEYALYVRTTYRAGYSRIESCNFKDSLMAGQQVLPINPLKVLENVVYYHQDYIKTIDSPLSPLEWRDLLSEIKTRLKYTHFNEICERVKRDVPEHITKSFTLMNIGLDIGLAYKRILDHKKSLVEYGTTIGMLASECTSESMTQRILDSIHASGASKSNFLTRIKEVYGAKGTDQLGDPYMDVFIKDEFSDDITTMQQIANEIEMMDLKTFVYRAQIFFEEYNKVRHPDYKNEAKLIFKSFEKHFINQKPPQGLLPWCIRLELSHSILIEKNMQVNAIYRKLLEQFPQLYIVYTDDNAENIVMRIYFKKDMFKRDIAIDQNVVHEFLHSRLLKLVIRGINGIVSATVLKEFVPRTIEQPDGSMKVIRKHIIRTQGTNLTDIINHRAVDIAKTSSNSVIEIQEMYGIHAARMKLMGCLRNLSGSDIHPKHYQLIADTLTYNGYISNIERSGVVDSNPGNTLLSMSYSHPIQAITEAGLSGEQSVVHTNISSSLMMGSTPNVGSNFNGLMMNTRFIEEHTKTTSDLLDDL
ncbi:RNA polymerase Rpb1, domain 4 [Phytophthora cactorum]|nr:RNA polymerase Rpb1, domain 4 [Phytophthora cactorum]